MPEILNIMLNVIAPIFIVVGLAALFTRHFNPDPRQLSGAVLYLFAPFLALEGIANAEIAGGELLKIGLIVVIIAVIMALIGLALGRVLGLDRRQESALVLSLMLLNAANYGIPLNEFAFGREARQIAIIYYVFSVTVSYTLGVFFASRGTFSGREAVMNVFKLPLIYAALFGLFLNVTDTTLPLFLARASRLLADASVPAMLVVLGMQLVLALQRGRVQGRAGLITLSTAGRLLLGPVIALGLTSLLGLTGLTQQVVILQSAMPTAVMAAVLATQFGADSEYVTSTIVTGTLASIVTLTVLIYVLN
jgi:malate permease and related proteins